MLDLVLPALGLGFFSMEVRRLMPEGAGCRA